MTGYQDAAGDANRSTPGHRHRDVLVCVLTCLLTARCGNSQAIVGAGSANEAMSVDAGSANEAMSVGASSSNEPIPVVTDPGLGHFVDVTGTLPWQVQGPPDASGVLPVPELAGVLLADIDGDGVDEVIVSPTWTTLLRAPVVFRLVGGSLVALPIALPAGISVRAVADLDGDGAVDLVAQGPYILWGDGHGGFSAPLVVGSCSGGASTSSNGTATCGEMGLPCCGNPGCNAGLVCTNGSCQPSGATQLLCPGISTSDAFAMADVNGDGWLDLLQFNSGPATGTPLVAMFVRTAPRTFTPRLDLIDPVTSGLCDSLAVVELQGVPTLVVNVSHGDEVPMPWFFQKGADQHWHVTELLPSGPTFTQVAEGVPMGTVACDLDGDGLQDYVMMSDPQTYFFSGTSTSTLVDHSVEAGLENLPIAPGYDYPPMGWAGACLDLNGDGRLDLIEADGNDVGGFTDPNHDSGPQPIKVWTRMGSTWQMGDFSASVGLGTMGQWHSISVGDIDGDGAPDFAVGGYGMPPRVFLNRLGVPSAALRLRTTKGQPAYNVHVDVPAAAGRHAEHLISGGIVSPLSQSDAIVFVPGGIAVTIGGAGTMTFESGSVTTVTVRP